MSRSTAFAVALTVAQLAVAGLVPGAHAEDRSTINIDVKGYDLSKPADAQKIFAQVRQAARVVCESAGHEVFASDEAERFDICFRYTVDNVVAQSKSPMLAALNGEITPSVRVAAAGGR